MPASSRSVLLSLSKWSFHINISISKAITLPVAYQIAWALRLMLCSTAINRFFAFSQSCPVMLSFYVNLSAISQLRCWKIGYQRQHGWLKGITSRFNKLPSMTKSSPLAHHHLLQGCGHSQDLLLAPNAMLLLVANITTLHDPLPSAMKWP